MRSLLFVPGDSPRKIEKALAGDADVVIFDLEDSVAPGDKDAARRVVADTLSALSASDLASAPAIHVRVNALRSGLAEDDLAAVMPGRPAAIMQPKTESGADIRALAALIAPHEQAADAGATGIVPIATETAKSLFGLGSYGEAGPRLLGLAWGAEDLSADLGATGNMDEHGRHTEIHQLARVLCLAGAVAAGVQPIDTVHVDFRDEAGLEREALRGLRDGFTGKLAIHPAQVAVINRAFTPSAEDIARAELVIAAFADAGDAGVVGLDGEMLDRPHLVRAEKLLARARAYGIG